MQSAPLRLDLNHHRAAGGWDDPGAALRHRSAGLIVLVGVEGADQRCVTRLDALGQLSLDVDVLVLLGLLRLRVQGFHDRTVLCALVG
jgi:hypothetical protein